MERLEERHSVNARIDDSPVESSNVLLLKVLDCVYVCESVVDFFSIFLLRVVVGVVSSVVSILSLFEFKQLIECKTP